PGWMARVRAHTVAAGASPLPARMRATRSSVDATSATSAASESPGGPEVSVATAPSAPVMRAERSRASAASASARSSTGRTGSQAALLATGACLQVPARQLSSVHGSPSSAHTVPFTRSGTSTQPAVSAPGPLGSQTAGRQACPVAHWVSRGVWRQAPAVHTSSVHAKSSLVQVSPSPTGTLVQPAASAPGAPGVHGARKHSPVSQRPSSGSCRHSPATQLSSVHATPSSHERGTPVHVPPRQRSPTVQPSASSQEVPSCRVGLLQVPVAGSHVPAVWHVSSAVQTTGLAPTQLPFWQVSVCVQASPSLQAVPLVLFVGAEHMPVAGLQVPGSWHWSAVQTTGLAPTQLPFWQVSVCVQALPSLQAVPLVLVVGAEHMPVAGLQVPGWWHWSAVQTTGFAPTPLPFWQASVCVQALPSLQGVQLIFVVGAELTAAGGFVLAGWWQ